MKAIIYSSLEDAQAALVKCDTIQQGEVTKAGGGIFAPDEGNKPYTHILSHPDGQQFALISDGKVEAKLKKKAVELAADWFNEPNQEEGTDGA